MNGSEILNDGKKLLLNPVEYDKYEYLYNILTKNNPNVNSSILQEISYNIVKNNVSIISLDMVINMENYPTEENNEEIKKKILILENCHQNIPNFDEVYENLSTKTTFYKDNNMFHPKNKKFKYFKKLK